MSGSPRFPSPLGQTRLGWSGLTGFEPQSADQTQRQAATVYILTREPIEVLAVCLYHK